MAAEAKGASSSAGAGEVGQESGGAPGGGDAPELSKPHPLEQGWTLWFDNPSGRGNTQSTWGQTLRSVYTFRTVEEFWWCVGRAQKRQAGRGEQPASPPAPPARWLPGAALPAP